jgi:uncharacterized membrane protein YfcA
MKKIITLPALATACSALSFGIGAVTFANQFPYNPVSYAQVVLGVAAGIAAGVMIGRRVGAPIDETSAPVHQPSNDNGKRR